MYFVDIINSVMSNESEEDIVRTCNFIFIQMVNIFIVLKKCNGNFLNSSDSRKLFLQKSSIFRRKRIKHKKDLG